MRVRETLHLQPSFKVFVTPTCRQDGFITARWVCVCWALGNRHSVLLWRLEWKSHAEIKQTNSILHASGVMSDSRCIPLTSVLENYCLNHWGNLLLRCSVEKTIHFYLFFSLWFMQHVGLVWKFNMKNLKWAYTGHVNDQCMLLEFFFK